MKLRLGCLGFPTGTSRNGFVSFEATDYHKKCFLVELTQDFQPSFKTYICWQETEWAFLYMIDKDLMFLKAFC